MTTIKKTVYFNSESPGFKQLSNGETKKSTSEAPSYLFQDVLDNFFDACGLADSRENLEMSIDPAELHDTYLHEVTITIEHKTLGLYAVKPCLLTLPVKATQPASKKPAGKRALKKAPK